MPVHGGMPVKATVERRSKLARRPHVGITVQQVAQLVWILFVDARQREIREAFRRLYVELRFVPTGGRAGRKQQARRANDELHEPIL